MSIYRGSVAPPARHEAEGRGRGDQDPSKTPPGPPRRAPGLPNRLPGPPPDAPRSPPGAPGRSKMFSEASGPITFFGKIEKVEIVENMSKKKRSTTVIHGGHSHRPLKNRKHFHNCRTPEGGGGGRAQRVFNKRVRKKTKRKQMKKVEKKSRQRSSTVVTRIGPHKNRKHFQNGRTQRVAAVVARSALQSAAPGRRPARRVVSPPGTSLNLVVFSSPLKEESFVERI